jgi:hypothetical protein
MTRLSVLAVIAGLIVVAVGAIMFAGSRPVPTPVPSVAPSVAPSVGPSASASGAAQPGPVPAALIGTWIAPLREAPGITQAATSSISFMDGVENPAEPGFALELGAQSFPQEARADEPEPGVVRLVSRSSPGGCQDRDVGRYRWSKPSDDALTLELVSDDCAARSAVVPGDWIRSGIGDGDGGPGIAADFTPFFEFTLPPGQYDGIGNLAPDHISVDGRDGSTFTAWKDVDGFVDACSFDAGRVDLDPGIDPFVDHLSSSSGLTVSGTSELTIDGHRAVRVDLATREGLDPTGCADGHVLAWMPHSWSVDEVTLPIGETDTVIVTEVDGATIVFRILDAAGEVPQEVVDSIRYIDALPMP